MIINKSSISKIEMKSIFDRVKIYVYALITSLVIMHVYYHFISSQFQYIGFTIRDVSLSEVYVHAFLASTSSIFLNTKANNSSKFILTVLYFFYILPCMLIAPIHGYIDSHVGNVVFILLYVSFIVLNFSTSIKFGVKIREFVSDRYFWLIFFLFWILFNLIVLSAFSGNLRFSGFDEIYEQREFAKTSVTSTFVWYSSGFLANCFNPFLISYGLSYNKKLSFIIGSAGQIFLFATAAQKIVIATIPLIIIFYIFVINKKGIKLYNIGFITAAACLSFLPVYYILNPDSQMGNIIQNLTSLVYLRTFCVPGAMLSIYVDYFSNSDLTYYSHSMAGALFSKYPYDAPVGEVIGGYVLNGLRYVNYNAGFFATDGVASLGMFGIVAASILVSYFLIFILIIFGKKEMNVVCGSFIPFTAALSNSSIFTSLLTGGGIVLIIILFFWISVKKGE